MDLDVVFLGTGPSIPSARRNTASVLVRRGGARLLFDCGEGTQRQMQRSTGLVQIDDVFVTHLHADHWLGLPGLIKTFDLQDRERPMRIFGPPGLIELFAILRAAIGGVRYELDLVELEAGDAVAFEDGAVEAFAVDHGVKALGYAVREEKRPGRFDPDAAIALGVAEGAAFGILQEGGVVEGADGPVHPEQVMGPERPGRSVVITGDTRPCNSTLAAADGAELLVHDATFSTEEAERALQTGHSTAAAAASIARDAGVAMLALVHISSRHSVGALLEEARAVFEPTQAPRDFDVVEIPLPERGQPRLLHGAARPPRRRRPAAESSAEPSAHISGED